MRHNPHRAAALVHANRGAHAVSQSEHVQSTKIVDPEKFVPGSNIDPVYFDSYGIGNLGKIIGPLGLALIVGSSNYVSPKVTIDAIFPALLFLAFWYGQAGLVFAFLGIETRGRSIEEISSALDARAPARRAAPEGIAAA